MYFNPWWRVYTPNEVFTFHFSLYMTYFTFGTTVQHLTCITTTQHTTKRTKERLRNCRNECLFMGLAGIPLDYAIHCMWMNRWYLETRIKSGHTHVVRERSKNVYEWLVILHIIPQHLVVAAVSGVGTTEFRSERQTTF